MAGLREKIVSLLTKLGGLTGGPSDVNPALDLWEARAEALITAQVAMLKAQAEAERKSDAEEYEAFLEGDPCNWLVKWEKETWDHFGTRVKFAVDLCSWMLQILSTLNVIDDGPNRQFVDDPLFHHRLEQWWRGWEQRNGLNMRYAAVDSWVRFYGTILVEARYQQGDALRPAPWVKMIPHRPQYIDVVQDPAEPARAQALRVFAGRMTDSAGSPRMIYHLWTDQYLAILEDWTPLQVLPNFYGLIPFIRVTNSFDEDRFFVEGLAAKMVPENLDLNRLLCGLGDDIEHLSGQPVIKAKDAPATCGQDDFIVLPNKDDDFWREGAASDISGKIQAIQKLLDLWTVSLNFPPGFLTVNPFEGGMRELSGAALVASQIGLNQDRERRQAIFRPFERSAVDLVAHVWQRHTGQDVRATDFGVAYPSISRSLISQADRRENLRLATENNWIPPWEALRELRPGLSDSAARILVAQAEAHARKKENGRSDSDTGPGEERPFGGDGQDRGARGPAHRGDSGATAAQG